MTFYHQFESAMGRIENWKITEVFVVILLHTEKRRVPLDVGIIHCRGDRLIKQWLVANEAALVVEVNVGVEWRVHALMNYVVQCNFVELKSPVYKRCHIQLFLSSFVVRFHPVKFIIKHTRELLLHTLDLVDIFYVLWVPHGAAIIEPTSDISIV